VLRIAFDLDGVLADMDGELARHAEALFGERAVRPRDEPAADEGTPPVDEAAVEQQVPDPASADDAAPVPVRLNINARQTRRLWDHVQGIENFWETLAEIEPGTIARLAAIASERRWEVIFLTKRPRSAGATAQVQTQRWLEARGFTLPSVFVVQGSRGRIASALALDVVVDDRPENCLDVVVDSTARAVLVWRSATEQVPSAAQRLGIGVVKSVAECLDVLTEADRSTREAPGLMSRVKRALGLNETTSA
jgi:hypothetical protein